MQVAHVHDYETHAVVGGKDIQGFGIAQTAEFFTVLSSTLYSNKPLAMVREYLCNAWDAHIAAGRQHIPVIITVDDDKIIFKDNGLGIPHDLIHQIYCVYGNSTKANDGKQTGGFGLGSKAGFAYSDHFTVVNCHAGTKVVHAISRGSALTQGTPDRREMVRVPTAEEGVEVTIPVKERGQKILLRNLVRDIAAFGEMNVVLNGVKVETVPISEGNNGLFLTLRDIPNRQGDIYVRYGNVIYPIYSHEEYAKDYQKLDRIINDIPGNKPHTYNNSGDWKLIIQADPNTISVTPSRESLSMTETTIATLKELIEDILKEISPDHDAFQAHAENHLKEAINYFIQKKDKHRLLTMKNPIREYGMAVLQKRVENDITDIETLSRHIMWSKDHINEVNGKDKIKYVLEALIASDFRRKYDLTRYLWMRNNNRNFTFYGNTRYSSATDFFRKRYFRPLLKKLHKHPTLNHKNLVVPVGSSDKKYNFADLFRYKPDTKAQLSLLAGVVVVTYGKQALYDDYDDREYSLSQPRYVYVAPRTKGHKDEAVAFFRKLGFHVIDFAMEYEMILAEERQNEMAYPTVREPRENKPEGLYSLENLIQRHGRFDRRGHLARLNEEDHHRGYPLVRINEPEYVFKPFALSGEEWRRKFFEFGDEAGDSIVDWIGKQGAIVANQAQYDAQIKKGRRDGYDYLVEKLSHEMLTNLDIRRYFELYKYETERNTKAIYDTMVELIAIGEHSPRLTQAFNLPAPVTAHVYSIAYIYKRIKIHTEHYNEKDWQIKFRELVKIVDSWTVSQEIIDLSVLINNNPLLACLDLDQMKSKLRNDSKNLKLRTFVEVTILNALKLK